MAMFVLQNPYEKDIIPHVAKHRKTWHLITEKVNPRSVHLDSLSPLEIIELISEEDKKVAEAVSREKRSIAKAVHLIVDRLRRGGRLLFIGAGTSGRLGIMEAAECPPTFGTCPSLIQGIIAGGKKALWRSVEEAEDSRSEAERALGKLKLGKDDVVVGIAASATTPFVQGGLHYAKKRGAARILITCNPLRSTLSDVTISLILGPEVISGSTRMKAGTATKMVLNMLTTASMVRLGKTYGNLMVEVRPNSQKLRDRAKRIVMEILGVNIRKAEGLLRRSNWNVKIAVVMGRKDLGYKEAKALLERCNGFLREALRSEP
ncbi:MAG TPA: N-acetylmuramic acid 6-phosphate etherase [Thermodesulfobacteriota bacterium]|nr:N-acetylmuramic acid 6-phosphate etherase [Thermodesulfobacteriota bacterium]